MRTTWNRSIRHVVAVAAAMVAVATSPLALGQPAKQSDGATPLRVQAYPGNIASLYTLLGVSRGFYRKAGLDVRIVQIGSGPQANAALAGGSVDIIENSPDNMLLFKARGFKPVLIVGAALQPNFVLIARDAAAFPNASRGYPAVMHDVVRRTIGIYGPGSTSERIVKFLLRGAQKSDDAVQFVTSGGPGQSIAGLSGRQIDLASDVFATAITAELSGVGKVILDCSVAACPPSVTTPGAFGLAYFTTEAQLRKQESAMRAFVAAHQQIDAWVHDPANKAALRDEIAKLMPAPPNVDPAKYFNAVTDKAVRFFSVSFRQEGLDALQAGMLSSGELQGPVVDGMIWSAAPK